MRHFFLDRRPAPVPLASTVASLTQRVPMGTPAAPLVTSAGGPHVQPPLLLRARSTTVHVPGIAIAADRDRPLAAHTVVSPERPLAHRNAIPLKDWTMPCSACIKDRWSLPLARTAPRARGRPQNLCPGPSLLRRQLPRIKNSEDWIQGQNRPGPISRGRDVPLRPTAQRLYVPHPKAVLYPTTHGRTTSG
jgi:hypothetical protein